MIRILIADDHASVRKGFNEIILVEYPSAAIGKSGDGETLTHDVIKSKWDVILCDISMPGRSGVEALHQINEINPKTPVLMMSMHPEDQYALRVLKAGASGYLNKDAVHDELITALQTVQIGRKYITNSIAEKLAGALDIDSEKPQHELLSDREFDVFKKLAAGKSV